MKCLIFPEDVYKENLPFSIREAVREAVRGSPEADRRQPGGIQSQRRAGGSQEAFRARGELGAARRPHPPAAQGIISRISK